MGCMLFELFAGHAPFDTIIARPVNLVQDMESSVIDEMPARWKEKRQAMHQESNDDDENETLPSLQKWLEKLYFDRQYDDDLPQQDIVKVGDLVKRLLRFEPSARASAKEILEDPWFRDIS